MMKNREDATLKVNRVAHIDWSTLLKRIQPNWQQQLFLHKKYPSNRNIQMSW